MVSDIPASTSGGAREQQQQHPSPQRSRLSLYALVFGLAGAPFAALAQISIGAALAGYACRQAELPAQDFIQNHLYLQLLILNLVALALGIAALATAWHSWKTTQHEKSGSADMLLAHGEGRSRFMAMGGLMVSLLFDLAILCNFLSLVFIPACGQ